VIKIQENWFFEGKIKIDFSSQAYYSALAQVALGRLNEVGAENIIYTNIADFCGKKLLEAKVRK
jgi:hypothetical protein